MTHQNATDVRKLAEMLDGTRETDMFIVVQGGKVTVLDKRPLSIPAGDVATIHTKWQGKGLRGGPDVKLSVTGAKEAVPDVADALFSTQSSFEKFALPYYVRTRSLRELATIRRRFYEEDVICIYHEPGSGSGTVKGHAGLWALPKTGKAFLI